MSIPAHNCPISSKISNANETVLRLTNRIRSMEDILDSPLIAENKKIEIQAELMEIKKLLSTNKEILSKLHKENTKSFAIAACLMFLCFLIYGVYCMIYGL